MIIAQGKGFAAGRQQPQVDFQCLAVHVTDQVLSRVANVDQRLLDVTAPGSVHSQRTRIDLRDDVGGKQFVAGQFGDQRDVFGCEQRVIIALDQFYPAVAGDIVRNVHPHVAGDGVLAVPP